MSRKSLLKTVEGVLIELTMHIPVQPLAIINDRITNLNFDIIMPNTSYAKAIP